MRHVGAERVSRAIEPSGSEVEADPAQSLFAEPPLHVQVVLLLEDLAADWLCRRLDLAKKSDGLAAQVGEKCAEIHGSRAGLVFVEQRVVRLAAIADVLGDAALQLDDSGEIVAEQLPFGLGSGALPGRLSL